MRPRDRGETPLQSGDLEPVRMVGQVGGDGFGSAGKGALAVGFAPLDVVIPVGLVTARGVGGPGQACELLDAGLAACRRRVFAGPGRGFR